MTRIDFRSWLIWSVAILARCEPPPHGTHLESIAMQIALAGFMGVGKSTMGRLLATELSRSFVDTDEVAQLRIGRSIVVAHTYAISEAYNRAHSAALCSTEKKRQAFRRVCQNSVGEATCSTIIFICCASSSAASFCNR